MNEMIFTAEPWGIGNNNVTDALENFDQKVERKFSDIYANRPLTMNQKDEIRQMIRDEILIHESNKPQPTAALTVEELRRQINSFNLMEEK